MSDVPGEEELLVVSLFTPMAGRREGLLEVLTGNLGTVLAHQLGFLGGGLYRERDSSRAGEPRTVVEPDGPVACVAGRARPTGDGPAAVPRGEHGGDRPRAAEGERRPPRRGTGVNAPATMGLLATDTVEDDSAFALGLLLGLAFERARTALAQPLLVHGLDLRHFALMIVLDRRSGISQRELAGDAEMDPGTVVRVLDDLEAASLARRSVDSTDRRVRHIALTDAGRDVFAAVHVPAAEIAARLLAHLDSDEADALIRALRHFITPPATAGEDHEL